VLETPNGEMMKLFRLKRLFSSAMYYPYAKRFVNNAKKLTALSIPTVNVKNLYYCPAIKRHIVIYQKLEGELLRTVLENNTEQSANIYTQFAEFVALLHAKGVYFRSIHLKNVLLLSNGALGLIDISDLQVRSRPLSTSARIRNFSHMLPYQIDKALMKKQLDSFLPAYLGATELSNKQKEKVSKALITLLQSPS
jgi:tRNA A-37 threonylcarbamoyl transferase component Bud32